LLIAYNMSFVSKLSCGTQVTMDVAESCNPLQALLRRFSASPALSQWLLQDLQAAAKALTSLLGVFRHWHARSLQPC
jgi:hypothetical protein